METAGYSPADSETAEAVIASAVDNHGSPRALIATLEKRKEALKEEERALITEYIVGIRPAIEGVLIERLESGVGGEYDGASIAIAKDILVIRDSVEQTIAQVNETGDHERYHKAHDHMAPIIVGASAEGDTVATIGGHGFTETALIEGLTVAKTGEEFVSQEYVQFAGEVRSAVAAAGISLEELEDAVDEKDLRRVDDLSKAQGIQKEHYALAI